MSSSMPALFVEQQLSFSAEVYRLFRNRPRSKTLKVLSEETGISERWLNNYSAGYIAEPSANKLQLLYENLRGKPLRLKY